jgi:hypothetical protein
MNRDNVVFGSEGGNRYADKGVRHFLRNGGRLLCLVDAAPVIEGRER